MHAHGLWPIDSGVRTPEEPGVYCFPPLAASGTGAGRLLQALAQADVEGPGGTYVACDTDSLLVVSSREGGLVPCPDGDERLGDGRAAVRSLSWAEVEGVIAEIERLNPYAPGSIPSLLKLEGVNFDPRTEQPEELYAVSISAKRYALYNLIDGEITLRKASVHGLGLYRAPRETDPTGTASGRSGSTTYGDGSSRSSRG